MNNWTTDQFEIEFNKVKDLILPEIFKYQIERVSLIVNHWQKCSACKLGYDFCEYSGSFQEVFLKLAAAHFENHTCNGDYILLWQGKK